MYVIPQGDAPKGKFAVDLASADPDAVVVDDNGHPTASSVLLSIRVARRSAAVAVIGQGEITRWIQRYGEGSAWVVMAARMRRPLGGSFSIVLGRCLRLSSTMRSRGRIGVCWSGGSFQTNSFDVGANSFITNVVVPHSTVANSEPLPESAAELYVRVRGKAARTDCAGVSLAALVSSSLAASCGVS